MAGVAQDSNTGGVELVASPIRMVVWMSLGLFMTGVAALLVFRLLPGYRPNGIYDVVMSYGAFFFFGAGTLFFGWRAFTLRGTVVAADAVGILDKRISKELIPWSAVADIRHTRNLRFVIVRLRLEYKASLRVSPLARFGGVISRPFYGDGYWINFVGLSGNKTGFLTAIYDYWERFKGGRGAASKLSSGE